VSRRLPAAVAALVVLTGCSPSLEAGTPSGAVSSATAEVGASAEVSGPAEFTLVATGDVLIHPALTEQAEADGDGGRDFRPLFAGVRPLVSSADVALCHLEVPLAGPDGPFSGYPSFSAPPEVADALADTGYDACSTASNHTLDQGVDGVRSTLDALDKAGLAHTGSYRSEQESRRPLLLDVNGVRVGHISMTYGFNGIPLPEDQPWVADQLDVAVAKRKAAAARKAGADVVVVSAHWGVEHQHEPTPEQRKLAEELLADDDIDLVIGHHAHVVQPMERIDGEWVAYGLGNHVARHAEPTGATEEGIAVRFTFRRSADGWRVRQAEYVPTLIDLGPPIRLRDLSAEDAGTYVDALERIDDVVLSLGAEADGLTRPGR